MTNLPASSFTPITGKGDLYQTQCRRCGATRVGRHWFVEAFAAEHECPSTKPDGTRLSNIQRLIEEVLVDIDKTISEGPQSDDGSVLFSAAVKLETARELINQAVVIIAGGRT